MSESTQSQRLAADVARLLAQRQGEFAVVGLARSGVAVSRLLRAAGVAVYASDAASGKSVQDAADALRADGVSVQVGGHDLARIAEASVVVVSPGVPPNALPIMAAHSGQVPVVSEVEIALRLQPTLRVIATTGTNGKSTTTALIGHLLRALGHDAVDVGNIGMPISEVALRATPPSWASLELSSFQLHDTPGLNPEVGVLTTLSADHLDRYSSVHAYYDDKRRLFANATAQSQWVVTADNADAVDMTRDVPGQRLQFSVQRTDVAAFLDRDSGALHVLGAPLMPRAAIALTGDHNVANVLAALLAVMIAAPAHATAAARATLAKAVTTFHALPHRLEPVADRDGVLWLNDSKATNVSSTLVALEGMTRPTIVLLGGRHKGESYQALVPALRRNAKAVLVYGEAGSLIAGDLGDALQETVPVEHLQGSTFSDVMARARHLSATGDVVLLSPACSSYDMFANYEERGQTFARLARGAAT